MTIGEHTMTEELISDGNPILESHQEESLSEVLDRVGRGEEEQERGQHVDIFETGNIWTQVGITQAQRKAWQNGGDMYDEEFEPVDIDGRLDNRIALSSDQELDENEEEPLRSKESDLHLNQSQSSSEDVENLDSTTQPSQSWWKEGKTAPLLNQYNEERRLWYLAQAGIYDQSDSVHDAQARQPAPTSSNNETREPSSSPPIVIYQTPARPTSHLPNANGSDSRSDQTPTNAANTQSRSQAQRHFPPQPIQTITNGVTPQRRGPAASLAGTINTPNGQRRTPTIQTPKRKTWQSTWASREEEAKAAALAKSDSTKKQKKNFNTPNRNVKSRTGIGAISPATSSSSKNPTPNRTAGHLARR